VVDQNNQNLYNSVCNVNKQVSGPRQGRLPDCLGDLEQGRGADNVLKTRTFMEIFENVIVNGPHVREGDRELLFGDQPVHFTSAQDIPNLLKEMNIFTSTSEARRAGRDGPIPQGFTNDFKASKKRRLWIWNPFQ
jgi:hypothetical protein